MMNKKRESNSRETRMSLRAVIFDLDGTLIDSLDDIAGSLNRVLAKRNLPRLDREVYRDLVGDGVRLLIERALDRVAAPAIDVETVIAEYLTEYRQCCERDCRFYPGIASLLDSLQRTAVPMAIISNKTDPVTQYLAGRFFSDWKFAFVSGEKPGLPRKPDPYLALAFARQVGLAPARIFFVGDSPEDMITAKRAGMVAAGVNWGFRPVSELQENGADIILTAPGELLSWIDDRL